MKAAVRQLNVAREQRIQAQDRLIIRKTKLQWRAKALELEQAERNRALGVYVARIQALYRGWKGRERFHYFASKRKAARALQGAYRIWKAKELVQELVKARARVVPGQRALQELLQQSTLEGQYMSWQEWRDSASGRVFYYNTATKDTQWDPPRAFRRNVMKLEWEGEVKQYKDRLSLDKAKLEKEWRCEFCLAWNSAAHYPRCPNCSLLIGGMSQEEYDKKKEEKRLKEMIAKAKKEESVSEESFSEEEELPDLEDAEGEEGEGEVGDKEGASSSPPRPTLEQLSLQHRTAPPHPKWPRKLEIPRKLEEQMMAAAMDASTLHDAAAAAAFDEALAQGRRAKASYAKGAAALPPVRPPSRASTAAASEAAVKPSEGKPLDFRDEDFPLAMAYESGAAFQPPPESAALEKELLAPQQSLRGIETLPAAAPRLVRSSAAAIDAPEGTAAAAEGSGGGRSIDIASWTLGPPPEPFSDGGKGSTGEGAGMEALVEAEDDGDADSVVPLAESDSEAEVEEAMAVRATQPSPAQSTAAAAKQTAKKASKRSAPAPKPKKPARQHSALQLANGISIKVKTEASGKRLRREMSRLNDMFPGIRMLTLEFLLEAIQRRMKEYTDNFTAHIQ